MTQLTTLDLYILVIIPP